MFGLLPKPGPKSVDYATSEDFCRIFEQDMNRLYRLSLLLTGDRVAAEDCFVQGLDDSQASNPVFKEWAESWARRSIVQNAIQIVRPRPTDIVALGPLTDHGIQLPEIAAILALPAFDRFAYVLSVLEAYPLQECALLLDCTRSELITARMRALQKIVKKVELHDNLLSMKEPPLGEGTPKEKFPQLAATA